MKAVILAGGKGTRLRPLTSELPKPMVPIMNIPVMEHIVMLLKAHGVKEICVTLMYMAQKIRDYFQDGRRFGVRIIYLTEDDLPLGTAGCIKGAADFLDETFLVISGDCMTDFDLMPAIEQHRRTKAVATLITTQVSVPLDFGVVIASQDGAITGFLEKPSWHEVISDMVNTGIYILEPEVLDLIKPGENKDFSRDIFPKLKETPGQLFAYACEGSWNDIGSLDSYIRTHADIFARRMKLGLPAESASQQIHVGAGTVIDPSAMIKGPCLIGRNCQIGANALIDEMCVIGDYCTIGESTILKRSILWNNCTVDYGCELQGAVIGSRVHLMHHVTAFENSIIGDETVVNEHAVIKSNIKIWPRKSIAANTIVDRNIVYTANHIASIFGRNGMHGLLNVDITPEYAARLGSAYGTFLRQGSKVLVSSDESGAARMFKHAFISGLLSAGQQVFTANPLFLPVARQAMPVMELDGGIHVMQDREHDQADRMLVNFLDRHGADEPGITEKQIESIYHKEEFRHCHALEIPLINEVHSFPTYYYGHLINLTQVDRLRSAAPALMLFSTDSSLLKAVSNLMDRAGCVVSSSLLDRFSPFLVMQQTENSQFLLSAYIDGNTSELTLIDRSGRIVSDETLFHLTSLILFRQLPRFTLLAPVNQSAILEEMARQHHGFVCRTKIDRKHILKNLISADRYRTAWSQYALQFDPISALLRITEYLTVNGLSLEELLMHIPPSNTHTAEVDCRWETVGRVMKHLGARFEPYEVSLIDGMKIQVDGGWVLVCPDTEQPKIHVYVEHRERARSAMLLKEYVEVVRNLVDALY